jgi:hypothetical protein
MAKACIRLLRYRLVRQEMAAAARERIVALFTLQRSLQSYRTIYRRVVNSHRGRLDGAGRPPFNPLTYAVAAAGGR